MGRSNKARQRSVERHAAKRKAKKRALVGSVTGATPRAVVRLAARWPVHECLISRDWNKEGEIVQIVVARRSQEGQIAAAVFLVDLACLGVKSAFTRLEPSPQQYERNVLQRVRESQPLVRTDLDLAAKVILEGVAYARRFGLKPDPDYYEAASLLEGADPDACDAHVPLGKDGKPFFVAGPYDNAQRIIAQLTRTAGPGNFDFMAPVDMLPDFLIEDDEDD
jgi:hypothetical protein